MNKSIYPTSLLVLGLFLVLLNTSCDPDSKSGTDAEIGESSLEGIEFKNKDNTVYVRLAAEPDRLNPGVTTSSYSRIIWSNIFQELLSFDPVSLEEVPILAKSRPIIEHITSGPNAGGVSYTYELFENAKWSDGMPVTAADVVFSYKAMFNFNVTEAAPYRPSYFFMSDIVIDPNNDRKFTVIANEVYFLAESSINGIAVLPAHVFDPAHLMDKYELADLISNGEELANDDDMKTFAEQFTSAPYSRQGDKLIGSGPYRLENWEEGLTITLSKTDNWWANEGHPNLVAYPDSLVYRVISDQTTAINALKDELIDINIQVDASDFLDLKDNEFINQHYNFYTPGTYSFYYIAMNNEEPRLEDKKVRRAMAHLVNYDVLINDQFKGLATKLNNTPVLPSKPYFDKSLKAIEFDIEKAKELLTEAGWKDSNGNGVVDKEIDGELLEMELDYLVTPGSKFGNAMANYLKDDASQAGVQINIVQREIRALLGEDVATRNYHLFGLGAVSAPIPDDFNQLWHTSSNTPGGTNRVQFGDAESDALIDKIRITLDEEERAKLYKEFQEIIYDEQPMVFLFAPQERIIISKRFDAKPTMLRPGFRVNTFKHRQGK